MYPPPGFVPTSIFEHATPTDLAAAIITASSTLNIGVDIPSTTSLLLSTATAIANSADEHDPSQDPDNGECRLLGPFAIFIQGALGLLALLALVYKRWRERPQRPLKIWSFDVSKQVVGSVLVHIANLLMSMLSSGQFSIKLDANSVAAAGNDVDATENYRPNPCSFYLLNLAIDTTVGIPILILLLRILTALFSLTPLGNPPESIQSGHYGTPPRAIWWFKQCIIYFLGLMGMKTCVLVIFLLCPWISRVGDWALKWTEGDEVLQVVFVMLVFPVIMNATQYYIIDSFIKDRSPVDGHERLEEEEEGSFVQDTGTAYEGSGSSDEIRSGDEDDAEVAAKTDDEDDKTAKPKGQVRHGKNKKGFGAKGSASTNKSATRKKGLKTGNRDYDPMFDGESSPTVVGSASTSERERLVRKEPEPEPEPDSDEEAGK